MRTIEVNAKTREEAIRSALEKLGVERDEVSVEILDEGSKGFFGLGAREVRIRVTAEKLSDNSGADAGALLEEIIRLMGIEAKVEYAPTEDGNARLNVRSQDSAILIGRKGRNLNALQHLINKIVHAGESGETTERILVDIEGYIDRRQSALEEMALRLAQKAKQTRRGIRLKPLSPQERRIVHLTLQNDPDVRTFSLGNSRFRSVVIEPKNASDTNETRPRRAGQRPRGGGWRGRPNGRGEDLAVNAPSANEHEPGATDES